MSDFAEFWKVEWETIVGKIRQDFEIIYGAMQQKTIRFYENKIKEIEIEIKNKVDYESKEQMDGAKVQEQLDSECDTVKKIYLHEKETFLKQEELYSE